MHEGGGRWIGSNKVVELKKKKKRLPASSAGGTSLIPGQGTKILCAAWHGQKKKKKK